jgi:hypothetical protein
MGMKMLARLGAAAPMLVAVFLMLVIVGVASAYERCHEPTPQAPVAVAVSTTGGEKHIEIEGYRGWVVRAENTQRVLGPFRLEADCYGAARMLNGARPGSYNCMAERQ